eukprot:scaffold74_cov55-Skeletonema_menzelii.AAC.1
MLGQTARLGHYGRNGLNPRVATIATVATGGLRPLRPPNNPPKFRPREICRPSKKGEKEGKKGAGCPQSIILQSQSQEGETSFLS